MMNSRTGWYLSDLVFTGDSGFTLSRVEVKSMQIQHKAPKRLPDWAASKKIKIPTVFI